MNAAKAALVLAVAMVAAFGLIPMAESDADITLTDNPNSATFDSMNGGSFSFKLVNSGNAGDIRVIVTEGTDTVYNKVHTIEGDGAETIIEVSMGGFTSVGKHQVTVSCESLTGEPFTNADSFTMTITVNENILSNWTTYVVIVIAIIVIAALIYIRMRDKPKSKNTMTFEELEAQRKAEMAQKTEKKSKKEDGASTERKRYLAEKKKKQN